MGQNNYVFLSSIFVNMVKWLINFKVKTELFLSLFTKI